MNLEGLRRFKKRRADRGNRIGRETEDWVSGLLEQAVSDGIFTEVSHHPQGTPKIDFTVSRLEGDRQRSVSFGVTSSTKQWQYRRNDSSSPQLCFPPGTKPETVLRRVLELFD